MWRASSGVARADADEVRMGAGTRVRLVGAKRDVGLNGEMATIIAYVPTQGAYNVRLDEAVIAVVSGKPQRTSTLLARPTNLERVDANEARGCARSSEAG